jgi:hypothetical protein
VKTRLGPRYRTSEHPTMWIGRTAESRQLRPSRQIVLALCAVLLGATLASATPAAAAPLPAPPHVTTHPSGPPAAAAARNGSADCASRRAAAKKKAKATHRLTITSCLAVSSTQALSTAMRSRSLESPSDLLPAIPEWCLSLEADTFWYYRTEGCLVQWLTVDVFDTEANFVAEASFLLLHDLYTDTELLDYGHLATLMFFDGSNGTGDYNDIGISATLDCVGSCLSVNCGGDGCISSNQIGASSVAALKLEPSEAVQGTFVVTSNISTVTTGNVAYTNDETYVEASYPGASTVDVDATSISPDIRCDNALPGTISVGCVLPGFIPTETYSLTGPFPELAAHISQAQTSGLPGAPDTTVLHRLTDEASRTANRDTACPPTSAGGYPRPVGDSCDEYPFASTYEGAYMAGGSPRTFPGCSITLAGPPSTGATGYSVCMIDATQNFSGGSDLNVMYTANRVINFDPFWVQIIA